jgi:HD superfamily phosphohydrolase YqeK
MLGARLGQVQQVDQLFHFDGVEKYNSPEQIAAAQEHCRHEVAEIRKLQKQLGIDDDAVISAIGVTEPQGFDESRHCSAHTTPYL